MAYLHWMAHIIKLGGTEPSEMHPDVWALLRWDKPQNVRGDEADG